MQTTSIYADGTYRNLNPDWHEEDSPWKAEQIRSLLAQNSLKPRTLCELGCGIGRICDELASSVPSIEAVHGYDVSPDALSAATIRYGSDKIRFFGTSVEDIQDYYDLALAIDVIEHVEDYMGFIKSMGKLSRYQIFHIPLDINVSSLLRGKLIENRQRLGHIQYFTEETAVSTIRDCGLSVLATRFTSSTLSLPSANKGLRTDAANVVRRLAERLSIRYTQRLLGGYSLLILSEAPSRHAGS